MALHPHRKPGSPVPIATLLFLPRTKKRPTALEAQFGVQGGSNSAANLSQPLPDQQQSFPRPLAQQHLGRFEIRSNGLPG